MTANVTITGTITSAGYAPGDVVVDGSKLNSLVTTGATFAGRQMNGGKIVAT